MHSVTFHGFTCIPRSLMWTPGFGHPLLWLVHLPFALVPWPSVDVCWVHVGTSDIIQLREVSTSARSRTRMSGRKSFWTTATTRGPLIRVELTEGKFCCVLEPICSCRRAYSICLPWICNRVSKAQSFGQGGTLRDESAPHCSEVRGRGDIRENSTDVKFGFWDLSGMDLPMQVHLASLGLDFEALGISQAGNDSGDGSRSPDMRAASESGVLICSIGRKIVNTRGGMGSSPAALHTYTETNRSYIRPWSSS